jgi:hypothetical protein
LQQRNAVDLLAAGKNDTEAAELLHLSRTCITKWRLHDPVFQAALNVRRAEVWGSSLDRLRTLIPKALDVLAAALDHQLTPHRLKAAGAILRLAQLPAGSLGIGPTDAEEIVRRLVEQRRKDTPGACEKLLESGKALPPLDEHVKRTWEELEALANEPDAEEVEA